MLDGKAVVVGHEKLGGIFTEQGIPGVGIVCRDACVFFHGRGDGGEVGFLRFLAVVPLCAEKADFIFHLYHDHGIFFAVCFPKVGHEAGECAGVGFYGGGAERGYGIGGVVGAVACTEVGYRILFYPGGGNHRSISFFPSCLAWKRRLSVRLKSKEPFSGSSVSQQTGAMTVFRARGRRAGHTFFSM